MTIDKPEVVAYIDMLRGQERRYASLRGDIDQYSLNDGDELIRLSDYETLQAECDKLRKDAERIEWLEDQTKKSWTGISFDYHRYAEYGYVVNHGYRFMRRHFASGFKDSLRKAIDAAMQEENKWPAPALSAPPARYCWRLPAPRCMKLRRRG